MNIAHGGRSGYSYMLQEAANKKLENLFGFRNVFVYERCNSTSEIGPGFTRVIARQAEYVTDFAREASVAPYEFTYVQHIVDNFKQQTNNVIQSQTQRGDSFRVRTVIKQTGQF